MSKWRVLGQHGTSKEALLTLPQYISKEEAADLVGGVYILRANGVHQVVSGVYDRQQVMDVIERLKRDHNVDRYEPATENVGVMLSPGLLKQLDAAIEAENAVLVKGSAKATRSMLIRRALTAMLSK